MIVPASLTPWSWVTYNVTNNVGANATNTHSYVESNIRSAIRSNVHLSVLDSSRQLHLVVGVPVLQAIRQELQP